MDAETVRVRLVGGPADWRGKALRIRSGEVYGPEVEPGAYLISAYVPERGDGEDFDPRAVYEPMPGGDPAVWHFQGWLPGSPADPPPGWYLEAPEERG